MTITGDENYVDTLTNTITGVIAEKVPTKSIKRNSIGLPIEIRELIRQKRHQRRLWQRTRIPQYKTNANRLQKRIRKDIAIKKRDSWKMYCDDMELPEGQDAAWSKIRSVLNAMSASCNYPTIVTRDEGGIKTRSVTTTETGDVRVPVGRGLSQRNRVQRLRRGSKDRRRRRIIPAHCQIKAKLPEGHPLWPRYPSRQNQVRRSDWHTREGKHKESPWPGPHHQQNHTLYHSHATHHSPGLAQHLRLPRLSP